MDTLPVPVLKIIRYNVIYNGTEASEGCVELAWWSRRWASDIRRAKSNSKQNISARSTGKRHAKPSVICQEDTKLGTITVIYSKFKLAQVNSTSHVLPGKQRMTTPFDPHLYENHTFITDNVYKQIPLPKVKGQSTSKIIVIITYSMSYALPFRDVRNGKQF